MHTAAANGHIAMCEYLHAQQCAWDESSTSAAALGGYLDLLRWFIDNSCPWNVHALYAEAAQGGSVEVLTYLQQHNMLTSTANLSCLLDLAACFNRLSAVKWFRAQGAQWPARYGFAPWGSDVRAWAEAEGSTTTCKILHYILLLYAITTLAARAVQLTTAMNRLLTDNLLSKSSSAYFFAVRDVCITDSTLRD
jgi:hypothetical protein